MFNGRRLYIARVRRGMTSKSLAENAGIGVDTVTRLEQGRNTPSDDTLFRLSQALDYPLEFFYGDMVDEIDIGAVSFRSFSKMTAKDRNAAIAAGTLGLLLNEWIEERFGLPQPDLLDLSRESDPEAAAMHLRQHWGLGQQPIGGLLSLLESKGIRLFSLSENTASVNAFSFWRGGKPFIYLNNFKTAESSRFDAAHELGHLVMHKHGDPKEDRSCEREADRFASAFLMPSDDVRARISSNVTTDIILRGKMRWRVSAMAMAYRLRSLQLLSEWQYKSICIELSRRGYRSGEPNGIEREISSVWRKILAHLWQERITKEDIARELSIPLDELEGLVWSLTRARDNPSISSRANFQIIG
ncbi:XRE family transcriptional regulator (plasmid) [Tistrella mobilis]|uniref:helix-turn-helix domain-containing protein n=1 Tax=Tistrella mobilis TaxID=171437 RepID=UPI003558003F